MLKRKGKKTRKLKMLAYASPLFLLMDSYFAVAFRVLYMPSNIIVSKIILFPDFSRLLPVLVD